LTLKIIPKILNFSVKSGLYKELAAEYSLFCTNAHAQSRLQKETARLNEIRKESAYDVQKRGGSHYFAF